MSGKSSKGANMTDNVLQKKLNIPVQMTDLSVFDDAFLSMKERFAAEMRRMDDEMTKFSTDLMRLYGQTTTVQTGVTSSQKEHPTTSWDTITSSPLVQGEGESKTLKLQFDVSQFDGNEVIVKIVNNVLIVSAVHEEKSDNSAILREYNREFMLPKGTDAEAIVSSLSRDGVLTVQVPLPPLAIEENPGTLQLRE